MRKQEELQGTKEGKGKRKGNGGAQGWEHNEKMLEEKGWGWMKQRKNGQATKAEMAEEMRKNHTRKRRKIKGDRETSRHRCDQIYIETLQLKPEPNGPYSLLQ